jgi:hypothetical protein
MTRLSENFTLSELTRSTTAQRLKIDNTPKGAALANLSDTAAMLQRIRDTLGVPVVVTSAYRSPPVNRAVGGVTSSDHVDGQAADFVAPAMGSPEQIARILAPQVDRLGIGQLILEGVKGKQWVHVSTQRPSKIVNRVLTITDAGARAGIHSLA